MLSYEYIAYDAINSLTAQRHVQTVHLSSIRSVFKRKLTDEGRHVYKGFDKRLHSRLKEMVEEGKLVSDERGLRFGLTSQARKIVNQRKRDGLDVDFRLLSTPAKGRAGTATPRSSGKKRTLSQSGTPNKKTASGTSLKTPASTRKRLLRGTAVGDSDLDNDNDTDSEHEQQQNMFHDSPSVRRRRASFAQSSTFADKTPQKSARKTPLRASQTKTRDTPSRGVSKRQIPKSTPRRRLHTSNELSQEEFLRLEGDLAKALDKAARLAREKIVSERNQRETARQQKADLTAAVRERDAAIKAADQARANMIEKDGIAKLAEEKLKASEAKLQELERRLEGPNFEREQSSINDFPVYQDENDTPVTAESESPYDPFTEVEILAENYPENIDSFDTAETSSLCDVIDVTNPEEMNIPVESECQSSTSTRIEEVIVQTTAAVQIEDVTSIDLDTDLPISTHVTRFREDCEIMTTDVMMENKGIIDELRSANMAMRTEMEEKTAELQSRLDETVIALTSEKAAMRTELEQKTTELQSRLNETVEANNLLNTQVLTLTSEKTAMEEKTTELQSRLDETFESTNLLNAQVLTLTSEKAAMRTDLEQNTTELQSRLDETLESNNHLNNELIVLNAAMTMRMEEKTELQSRLDEFIESKSLLNDQVISLTSEKSCLTSRTLELETVIEQLRTEMNREAESYNTEVTRLLADLKRARAALAEAAQETADAKTDAAKESAVAQERLLQVQKEMEEIGCEYQEKLAESTNRAETAEKQEFANRNALNEKERMVEELQVSGSERERKIEELETMVTELGTSLEKEKEVSATTAETLQRTMEEMRNEISMKTEELETARSELCRLQEDKSANEVKLQDLQSATDAMRMDMEEKAKELQSSLNETIQSHVAEKASLESRTLEMETAIQQLKKEMKEAECSQNAKVAETVAELERTRAALAKVEKEMKELKLKAATESAAAQEKIIQLQGALEGALENRKNEIEESAKVVEELQAVQTQWKASLEQVEDMKQRFNEARMEINQLHARLDQFSIEVRRIQEARDSERKAAQEALDEAGRKLSETETEREELERRLSHGAELVELMRTCVQPIRNMSASCSVTGTRIDSGVAGLQCGEATMVVSRVPERRREAVLEE